MSKPNIPIACDLNALPDRAQHEADTANLMPQAIAVTELDNGYQLEFPISALQLVAKFVDDDRLCCPFFHFVIDVQPLAQSVYLQLMGHDETKDFLKQELLPLLSITP